MTSYSACTILIGDKTRQITKLGDDRGALLSFSAPAESGASYELIPALVGDIAGKASFAYQEGGPSENVRLWASESGTVTVEDIGGGVLQATVRARMKPASTGMGPTGEFIEAKGSFDLTATVRADRP